MPSTAEVLPTAAPALQVIEGSAPARAPRGSMSGAAYAPQFDAPKVDEPKKKEKATAPAPDLLGRTSVIDLAVGETPRVLDLIEDAIVESGQPVFQRGGEIVSIARVPGKSAEDGNITTLSIQSVRQAGMLNIMNKAALYEHFDARKGGNTYCEPKAPLALMLMERSDSRLPVLHGVLSTPTLRSNGSILQDEGYDEEKGLVLEFGGETYPEVPEAPTKEQAAAALDVLDGLLRDFPFVAPYHRSAALALLLSSVIRRSMATVPMFGITATTPGTGKSFLADLAALMMTGARATCATWTGKADEDKKSLHALLHAGSALVQLDNVEPGVPVGGPFLNTVLQSERMQVRVLGTSTAPIVGTDSLFVATGNNLSFRGDMDRRVVLIAMECPDENPETRDFSGDPVAELRANRGKFVVAALTVLRAAAVAGFPAHTRLPLNGFNLWDKWVRGSLIWLGREDPVLSQQDVRDANPERQAHADMLEAWSAAFGGGKRKARDGVALASERSAPVTYPDGTHVPGQLLHPALRDAILAVAAGGPDRPDPKLLGEWLKSVAGRVLGGRSFKRGGDIGGTATWIVVSSGEGGGGYRAPAPRIAPTAPIENPTLTR